MQPTAAWFSAGSEKQIRGRYVYMQQTGRAAIDCIHWSGERSGSSVFVGGLHNWQIKSVSVRSGVSGESVCSKRRAAAGDRVASEARRLPSVVTDVLAGHAVLCGKAPEELLMTA